MSRGHRVCGSDWTQRPHANETPAISASLQVRWSRRDTTPDCLSRDRQTETGGSRACFLVPFTSFPLLVSARARLVVEACWLQTLELAEHPTITLPLHLAGPPIVIIIIIHGHLEIVTHGTTTCIRLLAMHSLSGHIRGYCSLPVSSTAFQFVRREGAQ